MEPRASHGRRRGLFAGITHGAMGFAVLAGACRDSETVRTGELSEVRVTSLDVAEQDALPVGLRSAPGPSLVDEFYPGFDARADTPPEPRRGGNVSLHTQNLPSSLNFMIDNSATARRMLYELHATLLLADWETWELEPVLAEDFEVEDDREYTFRLRTDVLWHDGHVFDADDVLFSYECYRNPYVDCDAKRYMFEKIERAEKVDERTVRFVFAKPHFMAPSFFAETFVVLPSHLYDLADPENPDHDPEAGAEEQGRYVNEHPNNLQWIGLGPYKLEHWAPPLVRARRFDGYFDKNDAGWVDTIQWRRIAEDESAMLALLNREVDYCETLSAERFLGTWSEKPAFTDHFYKGLFYTPFTSFTVWNMRRPPFDDARVRTALNLCFDWPEFIASRYGGLAFRVTSLQAYSSPTYDKDVEPIAFDLEKAREMLAEAGWYDRDGDGLVDKDGETLEVDFQMIQGSRTIELFVQKFQENLEQVGVTLREQQSEWSVFSDIAYTTRDFDALNMGWLIPLRSDPEHLWHSRGADQSGSHFAGLEDDEVDQLIDALQQEMDAGARLKLFHRLHRRLYELQPFMFHIYAPRKFALSTRIRGFQTFASDPGYSIRRWYVVE